MKILARKRENLKKAGLLVNARIIALQVQISSKVQNVRERFYAANCEGGERGDVPGWVLVVLMTTGLVTAIWTIAAPRLTAILRNSLDSMNGIR